MTFFVVGDIGAKGAPREAVARAMAMQMRDGNIEASFVLATGDNFYKCKSEKRFEEDFDELTREMMDKVI